MRDLLVMAITQENEKAQYLQTWIINVYFADMMTSLLHHVLERRERRDSIERVEKSL